MKTSLDCIPCFFRQALRTTKMLNIDEYKQREVIDELFTLLPKFNTQKSPPQMGKILYSMIAEKTGISDPFDKIKKNSNTFALKLYPQLKNKIIKSDDKLFMAVKLAIMGNIIDYGAVSPENVEQEISSFLDNKQNGNFNSDLDFAGFKKYLNTANTILYLGDNAGEIVFDKLLIEELLKSGKEVTFTVRGKPAINDVLLQDAEMVGLDKIVTIISNGSDIPGTILSECSPEFGSVFNQADIIISKGQGNFETLTNEKNLSKIFFMFKVKCPVVAKYTGEPIGTMVLKRFKKME